jgi:hypothetical protein
VPADAGARGGGVTAAGDGAEGTEGGAGIEGIDPAGGSHQGDPVCGVPGAQTPGTTPKVGDIDDAAASWSATWLAPIPTMASTAATNTAVHSQRRRRLGR